MTKRIIFELYASMAFALASCDDSQSVNEETQDDTASYKVDVCMNDVKNGEADLAEMTDKIIKVTAKEQTSRAVRLSDIISRVNGIEADKLDDYLSLYVCDFESLDGFRPSSKGERCALLSCSVAKEAYINVETHNLFYSDNSGITEGCYNIKNFTAVLMYDVD